MALQEVIVCSMQSLINVHITYLTPLGLYPPLERSPAPHVCTKATVLYPHNPEVYEQIAPPNMEESQRRDPHLAVVINAEHDDEVVQNENGIKDKIDSHKKDVKGLVNFLISLGISTAYDQQIEDRPIESKTQWLQEEIKDSDYVIIVITPSFLHLLNAAPEEELIFKGPYVHNLITGLEKRRDGSKINLVCVFLDRTKRLDEVPTSLKTGHVFELWAPFVQHDGRSDDLNTFLSLLNGGHQ